MQTIDIGRIRDCIKKPPVVYFCAEFAVDPSLPIYAGGLGILAGDVLGQAADDGRPYLGVGLFYHKGYLRQEISKEANISTEEKIIPQDTPLQLLVESEKPLIVTVPIHARNVQVKAWVYMLQDVPLLLLDTNVEGNEAQDINLCDQLYAGDREHRIKQEMILGIGGMRMIEKLGITPRLYHLNEGHSSMMLFELAYQLTKKNPSLSVQEALEDLTDVIFTNHTLVPAGNDVFSKDVVISYLASYAMEFPVDPMILVNFGLIQDSSLYSPTMLALRLATVSQAVSKLHAKKALEVWPDHPMVAVTNGVRIKYWQDPRVAAAHSDQELWNAHLACKKSLIRTIEEITGFVWNESDLILGWARRLANYKRPLLAFEDPQRLKKILSSSPVPVRLLFSGKPHPHDEAAHQNLQTILEHVGTYGGSIVYLQNYGVDVAKLILSGSDVVLNTPVRGFEACGTSGMKACANGVLLCTTLDGWTDEVDWKGKGWTLPDENTATAMYETLEQQVVPLYVDRTSEGFPLKWVFMMQASRELAITHYSAKRMLDELESNVYSQIQR